MRLRWLALPILALAVAACGGQAESTEPPAEPTPTVRMVTVQVGASSSQADDTFTYTDPSAPDGASTSEIDIATKKLITVPAGTTVRVQVDSQFPGLAGCWIANKSGELAYDNGTSECEATVN